MSGCHFYKAIVEIKLTDVKLLDVMANMSEKMYKKSLILRWLPMPATPKFPPKYS